jgi:hypothetical protein
MGDRRRATCRVCGRHRDEVGTLTWNGYCIEHGLELKDRNARALHAKSGPEFLRWRRAMAACVGGVLVDDSRDGA